jgi:hypothetical protein
MATQRDLVVDQGSRYRAVIKVTIAWLPDLTGYTTVRGTVKASQTLDGVVLATLDSYLTVSDVVNGYVTLDIPADASRVWDWTKGHYDMEISDGTPAHDVRFLQGEIRVDPEVTV